MAAPTYNTKGTHTSSNTNSLSHTLVTGAVGQTILLVVNKFANNTVGAPDVSTPTGFTLLAKVLYGESNQDGCGAVFYRHIDGSEPASVTVNATGDTGNDSVLHANSFLWDDVNDSGDPHEDAQDRGQWQNAAVTWDAMTIGGSERTLLAICFRSFGSTAANVPTGYVQESHDGVTTGNDSGIDVNVKENVSSDGSVSSSTSFTNWGTLHIALVPQVAGAAFVPRVIMY